MLDETTGTAVETVEPSTDGSAGSAPAQTQQDGGAGTQVEGAEESRNRGGLPKWAYNHERQLREVMRTLRSIQERSSQTDSRSQTNANGADSKQTDVWTDPDKWADAKIEKSVQAQIHKAEIQRQKTDALQYIRSQNDVTPDNEDEIAEIMENEGYVVLLDKNPKKAVDLALRDWREKNGIKPASAEASEKRGLAKQQAKGVSGTSASGAGQKKWSQSEIVEIAQDPDRWAKEGPAIMTYLKSIEAGRKAA